MTNELRPAEEPAATPASSLSAREWIDLVFDDDSFDETFTGVPTPDPLHFEDSRPYPERLEEARRASGGDEAVITGIARVGSIEVIAAVSDFRFIGGSMGYAVGERVAAAMDRAISARLPFVVITCSGGARMQEGMVALLQMSKTAAAAGRLHEAGIPMVSVLANPTTGGVYASYATQADVIIAENGALIGFAGPRVRAVQGAEGDPAALYAEDLLVRGLVDAVAPREAVRDRLLTVLSLVRRTPGPDPDLLPPPIEVRNQRRGWDVVELARHPERPRALTYIHALTSDYFPLLGDRSGQDDPALVGGLARIGDTNVIILGQERGDLALDGDRHDGRVGPAGYRKARRLIELAERLRLPLVTLVDTPGAHDALEDEAGGLAGTISDCLVAMSRLTVPSVSVVIGEGGSGGALALTVADRVLMQQNAMYAITSPEGAAAILFRDRDRAPEVAEALGVSAADLRGLGIIDAIVPEPTGGAHADPEAAIRLLRPAVRRALSQAMRARASSRRARREQRVRSIGVPPAHGPTILRNIADVLGDAAGGVRGAAGALGSRLRRRHEPEPGQDPVLSHSDESVASDGASAPNGAAAEPEPTRN